MGWPPPQGIQVVDTKVPGHARRFTDSVTATWGGSGLLEKVTVTNDDITVERSVTWNALGFPTAIGKWVRV